MDHLQQQIYEYAKENVPAVYANLLELDHQLAQLHLQGMNLQRTRLEIMRLMYEKRDLEAVLLPSRRAVATAETVLYDWIKEGYRK